MFNFLPIFNQHTIFYDDNMSKNLFTCLSEHDDSSVPYISLFMAYLLYHFLVLQIGFWVLKQLYLLYFDFDHVYIKLLFIMSILLLHSVVAFDLNWPITWEWSERNSLFLTPCEDLFQHLYKFYLVSGMIV